MPRSSSKRSGPEALASDMAVHAGDAAALLKALAHPARLLVLCQLVGGERTVGELQPATALGASALSQHLAVLRDMALVHTRREAQCIHYSLADGPAVGVLEALHAAFCAGPQPAMGRAPTPTRR